MICLFPSGLPISHRAAHSALGMESQLLQAFLTGYSYLALCIYPVPPLGSVDWLSLSGIGGVGLWSREGCGMGPNLHSMVTSIGASATAGIPNRMTPCPALHLYPGLQTPVLSTTYTRPPPAPRQVLLQQGSPISHMEIKIEKLGGGVCGLTFSLFFLLPL